MFSYCPLSLTAAWTLTTSLWSCLQLGNTDISNSDTITVKEKLTCDILLTNHDNFKF